MALEELISARAFQQAEPQKYREILREMGRRIESTSSFEDWIEPFTDLGVSGEKFRNYFQNERVRKPKGFTSAFKETGLISAKGALGFRFPWAGDIAEGFELGGLLKAANAMEEGTASEDQKKLVVGWLVEQSREKTWDYMAGQIISHAPAFMLELGLTGGIHKTVTKAVSLKAMSMLGKAVKEGGWKSLEEGARFTARRAIAETAGTAAGAAVSLGISGTPLIYRQTVEAQLPELALTEDEAGNLSVALLKSSKTFMEALPVGARRAYVEYFSERTGGIIGSLPPVAKLQGLMAGVFGKLIPKGEWRNYAQKLAKKGGWHGIFSEFTEERVADALNAAAGDHDWAQVVAPGWKRVAGELAGFAAVGGALRGASELAGPAIPETQGIAKFLTGATAKAKEELGKIDKEKNPEQFEALERLIKESESAERTFLSADIEGEEDEAQPERVEATVPPAGPLPDAINKWLEVDNKREGDAEPKYFEPDADEQAQVGLSGAKILVVDAGEKLTRSPAKFVGGEYILLDANATSAERRQALVLHELAHFLKQTGDGSWQNIRDLIEEHDPDGLQSALRVTTLDRADAELPEMGETEAEEEAVSKYLELITGYLTSAINGTAKPKAPLLSRIADSVVAFAKSMGLSARTTAERELHRQHAERAKTPFEMDRPPAQMEIIAQGIADIFKTATAGKPAVAEEARTAAEGFTSAERVTEPAKPAPAPTVEKVSRPEPAVVPSVKPTGKPMTAREVKTARQKRNKLEKRLREAEAKIEEELARVPAAKAFPEPEREGIVREAHKARDVARKTTAATERLVQLQGALARRVAMLRETGFAETPEEIAEGSSALQEAVDALEAEIEAQRQPKQVLRTKDAPRDDARLAELRALQGALQQRLRIAPKASPETPKKTRLAGAAPEPAVPVTRVPRSERRKPPKLTRTMGPRGEVRIEAEPGGVEPAELPLPARLRSRRTRVLGEPETRRTEPTARETAEAEWDEGRERFAAAAREGPRPKAPSWTKRAGTYLGSPNLRTIGDLKRFRRKIHELAKAGMAAQYWYEDSSETILNVMHGDRADATKFAQLLAIYSAGTSVPQNLDHALRTWYQHKAGVPLQAGRWPQEMTSRAAGVLDRGEDWEGRKTNNFWVNLMPFIDPSMEQGVTVDIWVMRALEYLSKAGNPIESPSDAQYTFAEDEVKHLADVMSWETGETWLPHQVQAAIWVTRKGREENTPIDEVAVVNFDTLLRANVAQLSFETIPGRTSGHMPEMFNASYEKRLEHLEAHRAMLEDGQGRNRILAAFGIPTTGTVAVAGFFEGLANPGAQAKFPIAKRPKASEAVGKAGGYAIPHVGHLAQDAKDVIDAANAVVGALYRQDAEAWHKPFYDKAIGKGRRNGAEVELGRPFTPDESREFFEHIVDITGSREFGPIGSDRGARFLNPGEWSRVKDKWEFTAYSKIPIPVFQKAIVMAADRMGWSVPITYWAWDGNYVEHDRSKTTPREQLGKGAWAQRSALHERALVLYRELAPLVDSIDRGFAERHGWTFQPRPEFGGAAAAVAAPERSAAGSAPAGSIDRHLEQFEHFRKTGRWAHRKPGELARISEEPEVRAFAGATDEWRAEQDKPYHVAVKDQIEQADGELAADYDGVKARLLKKAKDGVQLLPWEVHAYKKIIVKNVMGAISTSDPDQYVEAVESMDAYRDTGTEAGRALQARRDIYQTPMDFLANLLTTPSRAVRRKLNRIRRQLSDKRTTDDRKRQLKAQRRLINHKEAIRVMKAKAALLKAGFDPEAVSEEWFRSPVSLSRIVRIVSTHKSTLADGYIEYLLASMLSGPLTHKANILGNAAHLAWEGHILKVARAMVNTVVRDPNSPTFAELVPFYQSILGKNGALMQAGRYFLLAYQTEMPMWEVDLRRSGNMAGAYGSKIDSLPSPAIGHGPVPGLDIGRTLRFPSLTTLLAFDEAMKAFAGTMEQNALAFRQAKKEKAPDVHLRMQELLEDPRADIHEKALMHVRKITFQEEAGPIARFVLNLRNMLDEIGPFGYPVGTVLLPFVKTPAQIFSVGLGVPMSPFRTVYRFTTGQFPGDKTGMVTDMGTSLVSMLVTWAIYSVVIDDDDDGLPSITGSTASDYGERALAYRTIPAYHMKTAWGYIDYRRLEPAAVTLATTVDLLRAARTFFTTDNPEAGGEAMHKAWRSVMDQMSDKTFLRTVGDVYKAIMDRNSNEISVLRFAENAFGVSKHMPNIIRQPLRETDPFIRASQLRKYEDEGFWGTWVRHAKYSTIPSEKTAPPPRYDLWGRKVQRFDPDRGGVSRYLIEIMHPMPDKDVVDRVLDLDRLIMEWNRRVDDGDEPGGEKLYPRPPQYWYGKTVRGKKLKIYWSDDEYEYLTKMSGQLAASRLVGVGLNWRNPTQRDIDRIIDVMRESRKRIRLQLLRKRGL